jgi:hypothetical protein
MTALFLYRGAMAYLPFSLHFPGASFSHPSHAVLYQTNSGECLRGFRRGHAALWSFR